MQLAHIGGASAPNGSPFGTVGESRRESHD